MNNDNQQQGRKKQRHRSRRREDRARVRDLPIYKAAKEAIDEFELVGQPVHLHLIDDPDEPSLTIEQNLTFTRQRPVINQLLLDEDKVQAMIRAGRGAGIVRTADGQPAIEFEITRVEGQFSDKFRSRISFASYRQDIPKDANSLTYPLAAVRWVYFENRKSRQIMRIGLARPLNPAESNLPAAAYTPPPPPNQPSGMKVAFYPSADGRSLTLHPTNGKTIDLDSRYPFDPANYGVEIPVAFMQEDRDRIVAIPYEEATKELALIKNVTPIKIEADEIEWMGKARNVWELLEEYGVVEDSPLAAIHKARAKLGEDLSPDKDPVIKGFRERGQKVPANLESARSSRFEMLSLAFKKAIKIREAEEKEAADKEALEKAAAKAEEEEEKKDNHFAAVANAKKNS